MKFVRLTASTKKLDTLSMSPKKVAVTGGTGFLGAYLLKELVRQGHEPVVLSTKNRDFDYELRETDYSVESLEAVLADVDGVIHLAAKRGAQPRIEEFHEGEILTQNVLEAAKNCGIKHVVFASSISVYSDEDLLPWTEDQAATPISMYGIAKLSSEMIGEWYANRYGMKVKSLRMAHLFGALEKNNYMINIFIRKAYLNKPLEVKDSLSKREFLYAKDAALALATSLFKEGHGPFNIGSGEAFTNLEVAKKINEAFDNRQDIEDKGVDESIPSSYFSGQKAKELLGFEHQYSFSEALEEIRREMEGHDVQEVY